MLPTDCQSENSRLRVSRRRAAREPNAAAATTHFRKRSQTAARRAAASIRPNAARASPDERREMNSVPVVGYDRTAVFQEDAHAGDPAIARRKRPVRAASRYTRPVITPRCENAPATIRTSAVALALVRARVPGIAALATTEFTRFAPPPPTGTQRQRRAAYAIAARERGEIPFENAAADLGFCRRTVDARSSGRVRFIVRQRIGDARLRQRRLRRITESYGVYEPVAGLCDGFVDGLTYGDRLRREERNVAEEREDVVELARFAR